MSGKHALTRARLATIRGDADLGILSGIWGPVLETTSHVI